MSSELRTSPIGRGESGMDAPIPLSESGAARRDALLPLLQEAVVREGDRRRARRVAMRNTAAFSLLIVIGAAFVLGWPEPVPKGPIVNVPLTGVDQPVRITRLHTEPGVVERYAYTAPVDPSKFVIDDRDCANELVSMGRSTGLIRREGRVMLASFTPDPIRIPTPNDPTRP